MNRPAAPKHAIDVDYGTNGVRALVVDLAGGAHHTGFSLALAPEHLEDFAEIAGVEMLLIDKDTRLRRFKKELRWS